MVDRLGGNLEHLLERHFGGYIHLKKYVMYAEILPKWLQFYLIFIRNVTFEERDNCRGEAIATLRKILDLETDPVFTQNFDFFNHQEQHWSSRYMFERSLPKPPQSHMWESRPSSPIAVSSVLELPSPIPGQSVPQHTFPKYLYDPAIDGGETTWSVNDEIKVMANVQAYFQVAHKASIQRDSPFH